MKTRIVHHGDSCDSTLQLGATYRLTMGAFSRTAQKIIASAPPNVWRNAPNQYLEDEMSVGILVMQQIEKLGRKSFIIKSEEARRALSVCFLVSCFSSELSPRVKSMLREVTSIFAECCRVRLTVAYVPPYAQLPLDLQKNPIVARHYREIEAIADLSLKPYLISLAEAVDLFDAIQGINSIKMVLLRNSLAELTRGMRMARANISGGKR